MAPPMMRADKETGSGMGGTPFERHGAGGTYLLPLYRSWAERSICERLGGAGRATGSRSHAYEVHPAVDNGLRLARLQRELRLDALDAT